MQAPHRAETLMKVLIHCGGVFLRCSLEFHRGYFRIKIFVACVASFTLSLPHIHLSMIYIFWGSVHKWANVLTLVCCCLKSSIEANMILLIVLLNQGRAKKKKRLRCQRNSISRVIPVIWSCLQLSQRSCIVRLTPTLWDRALRLLTCLISSSCQRGFALHS